MNGTMGGADMRTLRERLQRLNELRQNPGTEGEALAAAAAISRLLLKHNLCEADIPDGEADQAFEKESFEFDVKSPGAVMFRRRLLQTIAKAHFCTTVFAGSGKNWSYIIGQRDNIEVVRALYAYLLDVVKKQMLVAWKAETRVLSPSVWTRSFQIGFVSAIYERFEAERNDLARSGASSNALVVQKDRDLERAKRGFFPRTSAGRNVSGAVDHRGMAGGKQSGKSVNLRPELRESRIALGSGK